MKAGLILGVNPKAKREENDFYATDPFAIDIVLPTLEKIGLNKNIWECACGKGHLAERLKDNGYNVYASDLIDRGYGEIKDFLKQDNFHFNGDILTNPPFRFAEDFVKKGFEVLTEGRRIILLLKIQFLETKSRKELFQNYPLEYVIVNSERICCAKDGEFDKYFKKRNGRYVGGTQLYAWYVFKKTEIKMEPKILFV